MRSISAPITGLCDFWISYVDDQVEIIIDGVSRYNSGFSTTQPNFSLPITQGVKIPMLVRYYESNNMGQVHLRCRQTGTTVRETVSKENLFSPLQCVKPIPIS